MKKTILLLILSVFYLNFLAQQNLKNNNAISNFEFQQKYNYINSKKNEQAKLTLSIKVAKTNYLSSNQVKTIAELFNNDFSRLKFVKNAYKNTVDKNNFYDVYDSFIYFSSVFRLHDYIKGVANSNDKPNDIFFPNYNYPVSNNYYGKKACNLNLNAETFYKKALQIKKQNNETSKIRTAQIIIKSYCISCSQLMKFASLLNSEPNRLSLIKSSYSNVYDLENYNYTIQVLKKTLFKNDLTNFINANLRNNNGNNNGNPAKCEVSKTEFNNILTKIKKQSFSNAKKNLTKQILKSKKCFKTTQIIEIIKTFSFSDVKLEMAKFAYDYTTDKDNYFIVADALTYDFDKQELLKYLKTK